MEIKYSTKRTVILNNIIVWQRKMGINDVGVIGSLFSPSGLVKVMKSLDEAVTFPLIGDRILVEEFGHFKE